MEGLNYFSSQTCREIRAMNTKLDLHPASLDLSIWVIPVVYLVGLLAYLLKALLPDTAVSV